MKKIFAVLAVFAISLCVFAQNVKSTGITDSDVKNWAKNCVSIKKEFEKLGVDDDASIYAAMNEKEKVESILQKNGISGPNNIDKYVVIVRSAAIVKAESEIDEESKALMQMMKIDPIGDLKKDINEKDYKVVSSNSKAVIKAIDDLDNYSSSH